jgi:hypothetical protein
MLGHTKAGRQVRRVQAALYRDISPSVSTQRSSGMHRTPPDLSPQTPTRTIASPLVSCGDTMQKSGGFFLSGRGHITLCHGQISVSNSMAISILVRSIPEGDCHEFFQEPVPNIQPMEHPAPITTASIDSCLRHNHPHFVLPLLPVSRDPCLSLASQVGEESFAENSILS